MPLGSPKRSLVAALFGAVTLHAAVGDAEETCPPSGRPVVELVLEVEPPDVFIATTLARHLSGELKIRGIDVCLGSIAPRVAITQIRLHVDRPPGGEVQALIQIRDAVTDKRLERVVRLTTIPPDGRPLAVASSTDELLRASWSELAMTDAPAPALPPPPEVMRAVASSLTLADPESRNPRFGLGVMAMGSALSGPREAVGGEGVFTVRLLPRLSGEVELGGDLGLRRSSTHGSIQADDLFGGLGLAVTLSPPSRPLGLDGTLGVRLLAISYRATATSEGVGRPTWDWASVGRVGLSGWYVTGRVRLRVVASILFVLRPSLGEDEGTTVTAIAGAGGELSVGATYGL